MGDITFPGEIIKKFNAAFPEIKETDKDRYGILTPGDILAGDSSAADKAIAIRDYLVKAENIDLDNNPSTKDVFIYRDASTVTLSMKVGNDFRPAFSLNFADPDDCFITYPEDHYNLPIDGSQCRMLRAAHPAINGLQPSYLLPATWITEDDKKVIISADKIEEANQELIKLANATKLAAQQDTIPIMFDIFKISDKATLKELGLHKIDFVKYPLIRNDGSSPIRDLSNDELMKLAELSLPTGKVEMSKDGKSVTVVLDDDASSKKAVQGYGWIVSPTDMKGLATEKQILFYAADDDHVQWTSLAAEQPVAILGEATDENGVKWYRVMTCKVVGFVKAADVALVGKVKAEAMWENNKVLTVTAPNVVVEEHYLEMGARLSIISEDEDEFVVSVSHRLANGSFSSERAVIKKSDVSSDAFEGKFFVGRVPFSKENATKLLFKYLGTPWAMANEKRGGNNLFAYRGGDRIFSMDCSGIIEKAMTAMGLYAFSRTSKWQARQGEVLWEKKDGAPTADEALDKFGTNVWLIGMPGHIMFYLGKRDGAHWMIHSPGHFRKYSNADDFVRIGDGEAVVTPVSISDLNKKFDVLMAPKK